MRAILIDPEVRDIREIDIDPANTLAELYRFIKCEMVELCERELPGVPGIIYLDIWIDEEGRLKPVKVAFEFDGEPFAGLAVITGGADAEGDMLPLPKSITIDDIKPYVRFLSEEQAASLTL